MRMKILEFLVNRHEVYGKPAEDSLLWTAALWAVIARDYAFLGLLSAKETICKTLNIPYAPWKTKL